MLQSSCAPDLITDNPWEGAKGNLLRVHVRVLIPEEINDVRGPAMDKIILSAGIRRASLILAGTASTRLNNPALSERCIAAFDTVARDGRIRSRKCDEDFCRSVIDFNITDFINAAGLPDSR